MLKQLTAFTWRQEWNPVGHLIKFEIELQRQGSLLFVLLFQPLLVMWAMGSTGAWSALRSRVKP